MRNYLWLVAAVLVIAEPASAQSGLDQMQSLARQLDKHSSLPAAVAADSGMPGKGAQPTLGIISQPAQLAADKGPTVAAAVGWNAYTMTACIAFVYGSSQYNLAYFSTGAAFITQSSYAIPIIAANCASGKTFLVYIESDGTTVTAVASYPRQ